VLQGCPKAKIVEKRTNDYPVRVKITNDAGDVLWEGRQQELFRKNATKRSQSVKEIQDAAAKLSQ